MVWGVAVLSVGVVALVTWHGGGALALSDASDSRDGRSGRGARLWAAKGAQGEVAAEFQMGGVPGGWFGSLRGAEELGRARKPAAE